MLKITRFTVENMTKGCVTDNPAPEFEYSQESDNRNVCVKEASILINDAVLDAAKQIGIKYNGKPLCSYTVYNAVLNVCGNFGKTAQVEICFETGRMNDPWSGTWISDPQYVFSEEKTSPVPMMFRKVMDIKNLSCR